MTPKKRVETVLWGGVADKVPFTSYPGEIPDDECLEILLNKEICIVQRMSVAKTVTPNCKEFKETIENPDGTKSIRRLVTTPHGNLTSLMTESETGYCPKEFFFKTPGDYKKIAFWINDRQFTENYAAVLTAMGKRNESHIFRGAVGAEPMQKVITIMGVENFCMEWMDNRDEVLKLYHVSLEENRRQYEIAAKGPLTHMNCGGNCVPEIVGLERFRDYFVPFYNEVSEYMHKYDKLVGTHLDANTRLWIDEIAGTSLDYIEAFCPPPDGDLSVKEALQAWKNKVLWINFPSSVHLQGKQAVKDKLKEIFVEAEDGRRLIVGITETVPDEIARETFPYLADCINQLGKLPLN